MFIGKISELTGASRRAIRHYEELGLLKDIVRSGSYRIYNEKHVVTISMIKRAQLLGFTLADIAPLILAKQTERDFPLGVANSTIDKKRDQIKLEIKKAKELDLALISLKKDLKIMFS